jgi:hypothetical protein
MERRASLKHPMSAEHLQALRDALLNVDRENTRSTAALLGSAFIRPALSAARKASIDLLEEVTRNKEPNKARQAAFRALEDLAVLLVQPAAARPTPDVPASPAADVEEASLCAGVQAGRSQPAIVGRRPTAIRFRASHGHGYSAFASMLAA